MIQAFRIIEISKYDDGGQLTTRGQLMQGSSSGGGPIHARVPIHAQPSIYPKQSQLNNKLQTCMINLMIIYDVVNIFV